MTGLSVVSAGAAHIDRKEYLLLSPVTVLCAQPRNELLRKAIHTLIACVPMLVKTFGLSPTLMLLAAGIFIYSCADCMRLSGRSLGSITRMTTATMRPREADSLVIAPITLGAGALCALLLFPPAVAEIAIYALAFGDSVAGIVGTFFGATRVPGTSAKTWEGSLACMLVVFVIGYLATRRPLFSIIIAVSAMLAELYSGKDMDNLTVPISVGASVQLLLLLNL